MNRRELNFTAFVWGMRTFACGLADYEWAKGRRIGIITGLERVWRNTTSPTLRKAMEDELRAWALTWCIVPFAEPLYHRPEAP